MSDLAGPRRVTLPPRRDHVGPCYWRNPQGREYFFRAPAITEAAAVWELIRTSEPLELNSPYCYLLLSTHFADTCVVAERHERLLGFVAAFVSPARPDVVFVWQIAVARDERGQGLGRRMLHQLLARPACGRARVLEATVTGSNAASRELFHALGRDMDVPVSRGPGFGASLFPGQAHEDEELMRVGPLPPQCSAAMA